MHPEQSERNVRRINKRELNRKDNNSQKGKRRRKRIENEGDRGKATITVWL
jgi:hypothetical protein